MVAQKSLNLNRQAAAVVENVAALEKEKSIQRDVLNGVYSQSGMKKRFYSDDGSSEQNREDPSTTKDMLEIFSGVVVKNKKGCAKGMFLSVTLGHKNQIFAA